MWPYSERIKKQQELKEKYGWLYPSFVRIFAAHDPMGLIRMGAPQDEYEGEVDYVLSRIQEALSPETLGVIMQEEFGRAFDKAYDLRSEKNYHLYQPRFRVLGEAGWKEWMRWKEEKGHVSEDTGK